MLPMAEFWTRALVIGKLSREHGRSNSRVPQVLHRILKFRGICTKPVPQGCSAYSLGAML